MIASFCKVSFWSYGMDIDAEKKLLLEHLKKLPPMSPATEQVLGLLNEKNSSWKDIGKFMLRDPVLTGRVLQIANSAFYGLHRQINNVEAACAVLGSDTLRGLISSLILLARFRQCDENSLIDYENLWKNSLHIACLAKNLAQKVGYDHNVAFTAGLFNCIDLVIQDYFFKSVLAERIKKIPADSLNNNQSKIHSMINTECWNLSAALLEFWKFPQTIVSVFSESDNSVRELILLGVMLIKSINDENYLSDDACFAANYIFKKKNIPEVDYNLCLEQSDLLFHDMSGFIFNNPSVSR